MYQATQSIFASFWKEIAPKDAFSGLWKTFSNWDEKAVIDFLLRDGSHKANEARTILGFSQAVEELNNVSYDQMEEKLREIFLSFCKSGDAFTHWPLVFCPKSEWFNFIKMDSATFSSLTAGEAFAVFANRQFSDRWEKVPDFVASMKPLNAAGFFVLLLDYWCGILVEKRSYQSSDGLACAFDHLLKKDFKEVYTDSLQRQVSLLCEKHQDDVFASKYLPRIKELLCLEEEKV